MKEQGSQSNTMNQNVVEPNLEFSELIKSTPITCITYGYLFYMSSS
jgi:hypothetical protein